MSVVLSFSYNGTHRKSNGVTLNAIEHLKMLIAAIDCVNPDGKHDAVVSGIFFNPWQLQGEEHFLSLQLYKRTRAILNSNRIQGHQNGAATSIRMATEYAAAIGAEHLIHLAEDVVMDPACVDYFLKHLADTDYVGCHWFMTGVEKRPVSLTTQVFGCRVPAFADLETRQFIMPYEATEIECDLYNNIVRAGLRYKVGEKMHTFPEGYVPPYWLPGIIPDGPNLYEHTHDPIEFRRMVELKGVRWASSSRITLL